jgi:fluoroquinolone resistance protein
MERNYTAEKEFNTNDFTLKALPEGDYENCSFINCNFSGSSLVNISFIECHFTDCDISLANLTKTAFKNVHFKDCKLKIKKTKFISSTLHEVDFTETDLTAAVFDNCDLSRAIFENTVAEKADFSTACNYSINPESNRIKKAKFSTNGIAGLLDKYDIEII